MSKKIIRQKKDTGLHIMPWYHVIYMQKGSLRRLHDPRIFINHLFLGCIFLRNYNDVIGKRQAKACCIWFHRSIVLTEPWLSYILTVSSLGVYASFG